MGKIVSANDLNFENFLQNTQSIIVDFWAPTCAPCRLIDPSLEKVLQNHGEYIKVLKVNVNESPKTSSKYLVRTLPTLLFIKNGQVKTQLIGAVNPNQIEKVIVEVF